MEWTETLDDGRIVRGGSFNGEAAETAESWRGHANGSFVSIPSGFRLAMIPEPGVTIDIGYVAVWRAPPRYIGFALPRTLETVRL